MDSKVPRLNEVPPPDALQRARDYGIDLSLLEENLRLSPRERLEKHDLALQLALELQAVQSRRHGNPRT